MSGFGAVTVALVAISAVAAAQVREAPEAVVSEARALVVAGRESEAVARLQPLATPSASADVHYLLGLAYYRRGDHLAAIPHLEAATARAPGMADAAQLLGLAYYSTGRPEKAIPWLERIGALKSNNDSAYVLAMSYAMAKRYDDARRAIAIIFDVPMDSPAASLLLARMLVRQGFDPIAADHAQQALAGGAALPLAHMVVGEVKLYEGKPAEAAAAFEKELRLNPANAAAYHKLAEAYIRMERYQEARVLLQRSIWLDAEAAEPYLLLGKVLLKTGDAAGAERQLKRAVALAPRDYRARRLLGEAYRAQKKNELAEREFKISAELPRPK